MDYDELARLENLRRLTSQREFAALQSKEAELRQQLAALQAYRTELHMPDPELRPMRAIGADVLWNRWLDQTQTTLNMSLARVLAQKETLLRKVRRDVGRAETVRALQTGAQRDKADTAQKAALEKVLSQALLQVAQRP